MFNCSWYRQMPIMNSASINAVTGRARAKYTHKSREPGTH